jgi:hypothetical protein
MYTLADGVVKLVPVDGLGSRSFIVVFYDVMCFGDVMGFAGSD